jgi:hypothetical protein
MNSNRMDRMNRIRIFTGMEEIHGKGKKIIPSIPFIPVNFLSHPAYPVHPV